MSIFNIIIMCFSYTTIMAIAYTLLWGLTKHIFKKVEIYYQVVLGFLMGLISCFIIVTLGFLLKIEEADQLSSLLPIFLYWLALFFISPFSIIGVLTFNFISLFVLSSDLVFFGTPEQNKIIISIAYVIPFILYCLTFKFKKLTPWLMWSITTFVILITAFFINIKTINNSETVYNFLTILMWLGSGYLTYLYIAIIDKIYNHQLKLSNIVKYENSYYLNFVSAHEQILNIIHSNKIKNGIYLTFFISNFDKFEEKVDNTIKDHVVESISKEVHDEIIDIFVNSMFFKPSYKTFGIFIPLNKKQAELIYENKYENKILEQIEKIFNKVNLEFKINKFKVGVTLKKVISYYGIDSNSLDKLLEFNKHIENNQFNFFEKNLVVINQQEILDQKIERQKMLSLSEIIPLSQSVTLFEAIYDSNLKEYSGFNINHIINGYEIDSTQFKNTLTKIEESGLMSLLLRFLSFKGLKNCSKNSLKLKNKLIFFKYDTNYIASQDFDIKEFIYKIKSLKITLSNLVIGFNLKEEIDNRKVLTENIEKLKKHKIKVFVYNFSGFKSDISLLTNYQPEYIFLEEEIIKHINHLKTNEEILIEILKIAKKIDAQIIAPFVNTYIIYKKLKILGVTQFNGQLLGSWNEPKQNIDPELLYLLNK